MADDQDGHIGRAIIGATVTVTDYPSGAPSVLYTVEGGSPIGNVLVTDATGDIKKQAIVGDRLEITQPEIGGDTDKNEVFHFELPGGTASN